MIDQLHLSIRDYSCQCGNRWTHSFQLLAGSNGSLGGTPNAMQEHKLQVQSYDHYHYQVSNCYRCVKLGMNEGWVKQMVAPPAVKTLTAEEELLI